MDRQIARGLVCLWSALGKSPDLNVVKVIVVMVVGVVRVVIVILVLVIVVVVVGIGVIVPSETYQI